MLGDQVKSLIIISRAKGWDPTVIPEREGQPAESIANFDKSPQAWETSDASGQWAVRNTADPLYGAKSVGQLPEGIHGSYPQASQPQYSGEPGTDWENVDAQGPNRASSGADPFSGMGGM